MVQLARTTCNASVRESRDGLPGYTEAKSRTRRAIGNNTSNQPLQGAQHNVLDVTEDVSLGVVCAIWKAMHLVICELQAATFLQTNIPYIMQAFVCSLDPPARCSISCVHMLFELSTFENSHSSIPETPPPRCCPKCRQHSRTLRA